MNYNILLPFHNQGNFFSEMNDIIGPGECVVLYNADDSYIFWKMKPNISMGIGFGQQFILSLFYEPLFSWGGYVNLEHGL
jgi:hypothetical protein